MLSPLSKRLRLAPDHYRDDKTVFLLPAQARPEICITGLEWKANTGKLKSWKRLAQLHQGPVHKKRLALAMGAESQFGWQRFPDKNISCSVPGSWWNTVPLTFSPKALHALRTICRQCSWPQLAQSQPREMLWALWQQPRSSAALSVGTGCTRDRLPSEARWSWATSVSLGCEHLASF